MIKNAWISKGYKNLFLKKEKNFLLITHFFMFPFQTAKFGNCAPEISNIL